MRKHPRIAMFFILLLFFLAVLINIPKEFTISYVSPALPVINKKIFIQKHFNGFNPNFLIGGIHIQKDFSFKKGLDLEGGSSITLKADMKGIKDAERDDALESAKTVIEKRVNFFGVSEPLVQTAKVNQDYRIIVEIPGVTDVNAAVNLIGTTAKLTFWEEGASESAKLASPSAIPRGLTYLLGSNPKETNLSGKDLQQAAVTFDQRTGSPQVQLLFTSDGTKKFADITKRNVGKIVAMVLDNQVVEAPRVNEPILNGSAVITGDFKVEQAKAIAIQLNAGALPVPLSVLEQHTVGATLGNISLQKSLIAGILGFFVIVIFMIALYGRLGVIASLALFLYTLLVLSFFRTGYFIFPPVTITLAGIAGFILSIGIAVDANILIFERMREELRRGKPDNIAIELGFLRAWPSIRDSNIASIITSFILIVFGTGIVRGFAVTLFIGVLVSMFSAIFVTRTLVRFLYKSV